MMRSWLSAVLDAVLPASDDVRLARSIREEELAELFNPQSTGDVSVVSLFPYRDPRIRALIRSVKFYGEKTALPLLGRMAGEYLIDVIADKKLFAGWETPLLVPMPSSKDRERARGYNQVERFADACIPYLESAVTHAPNALARKNRKSQVHVPRPFRASNVRGAFFVPDPGIVRGKHIILLDDVIESGATMKDARRALLEAGAAGVFGVAIAR
jgi:predicted amidophosphoribosyltransferase